MTPLFDTRRRHERFFSKNWTIFRAINQSNCRDECRPRRAVQTEIHHVRNNQGRSGGVIMLLGEYENTCRQRFICSFVSLYVYKVYMQMTVLHIVRVFNYVPAPRVYILCKCLDTIRALTSVRKHLGMRQSLRRLTKYRILTKLTPNS